MSDGRPERRQNEERTSEEDGDRGWELSPDEIADIDVSTSVNARWLKFGVVPETKVSFEGYPAERSSSRTERENLPDEVEAGVPYRDIKVTWRARSRIVHPTDAADAEDRE